MVQLLLDDGLVDEAKEVGPFLCWLLFWLGNRKQADEDRLSTSGWLAGSRCRS